MKQEISESEFIYAFDKMGRENNFSYEGRVALFEYLTDLEEDTETEIELDVIAICCDYNEYENIEEFWKDYDKEDYPTIEAIEEATSVIKVGDEGFIIQAF